MKRPDNVLKIFEKYTPLVDAEIKRVLVSQPKYEMYDMLSYFFGYLSEDLKPVEGYGGKRFRPGITLLLSDFYGSTEKALKAAAAIEIFHNFTLIHDDIEDEDPMRRGRPTVWKKWDLKHGINSGDAQFTLALQELCSGNANYTDSAEPVVPFFLKTALQVVEGQFLDFKLSDLSVNDSFVSRANYLEMIGRKSAVLVGASAKMAGLIAGKSHDECQKLWDYGYNLGMAYQLNDDLISIWGTAEETGKIEINDLIEKKKTYPVIHLYGQLPTEGQKKFANLYDQDHTLAPEQVTQVKEMLSENEAHDATWTEIRAYIDKSNAAIEELTLNDEQKDVLRRINSNLIPDAKWWDA